MLKTIVFVLIVQLQFLGIAQDKTVFDVARTGTLEEIKALVLNDKDVINTADERGYYPLTLACYHGNKEVAIFLVNNVKDVNVNISYGTPLIASVFKGHLDLVDELLNIGADPNVADVNGSTGLHFAVIMGKVDIVTSLLKYNADINLLDNKKRKPIDYALISDNKEIIKLLNK
ncbi:ankyrin repeat domain-containing protein [Winogradskyella sp. UBA3174]|uniref:ankyrin repeat domain-containing protein n=1 Tax=Winogradskyella sp. UBA3174 TaxID=1947785 RepID=UPI0025E836A3|nr:ankyrin repeat domain-containing protein [Winogradskyella sp. UBA3174]|tara:strand:+ start:20409 stop:20930 length:522 start_codon:yes stop_codon:yes gene_type:complete